MTTITAGLASLSTARSTDAAESLATSGRGGDAPRARRLYTAFVAAQVALAFVLFVAAGLLSRSFYNLVTAPRGFDGSRVLTARISLPPARYGSHEKILMYYDQLLPRLRALPGASLVSGTWALPFSDDFASSAMVPGDRPAPDHAPPLAVIPVLPSFFQTLGVTLREGRDFSAADREGSPHVAVVNETLARTFWPRETAIGKRLRSAKDNGGDVVTIVGVVSDIKRRGLDQPPEPEIYLPYSQATYNGDLWVTLRTDTDPNLLVPSLRRTMRDLDHTLPLALVSTLDQMVESTVIVPRFRTMLIGTFAVLAGIMALLGVYGALGFVVARRKQEIAIRGALGATPTRAFRSVAGQAIGIAGVGIAFGVLGAIGASVGLRSLVFGISAFDPMTFVAAVVALGGVAILGAWLPARRASRVDPMLVLREDASV
jgi:putative ABC transport system permease protein